MFQRKEKAELQAFKVEQGIALCKLFILTALTPNHILELAIQVYYSFIESSLDSRLDVSSF